MYVEDIKKLTKTILLKKQTLADGCWWWRGGLKTNSMSHITCGRECKSALKIIFAIDKAQHSPSKYLLLIISWNIYREEKC
jgi:hypothetical protein